MRSVRHPPEAKDRAPVIPSGRGAGKRGISRGHSPSLALFSSVQQATVAVPRVPATAPKSGVLARTVILSVAKDHLATLDPRKMILRYAQDDRSVHSNPQ